ncbi:RNA polymerase sigma factor [Haloferula sp. A504]|uniref:RNA polymerase sigma factor n=1 Tax=Haloferula sp. A504 TaxID=3373601 RepID=UPI0031C6D92E|nr:sigma-70 family RNA polymerase sigma factor [Verrucomicrobiaceae bacterium E54]
MPQHPDLLPTRRSLIVRASSGPDGKPWEDLLKYYDSFITKILLRMGFRDMDLEDVRQQVSLKLWQGLGSYQPDEGRARFRNWLSTLIRNCAIDWIRAHRWQHAETSLESEDLERMDPERPEIEGMIEQEWQRHVVDLAIGNLRQVFSGKALQVFALSLRGESVDSIAERLKLRRESVYVLKTRVKARVRLEIARLQLELEGHPDE